ncbi:MAG TPA: hypothetical protein VGD37_13025 [Kofleriaceae bacterium]
MSPAQREGGSSPQWARMPRARQALIVLLSLSSAAACTASLRISGDDDGDRGNDTGGSPSSDPGASDAGSASARGAITVGVHGPGRITSTPAGIDCGAGATACTARFAAGAVVLTTDDTTTVRWGGACSGNASCTVTAGDAHTERQVTAETFAPLRLTFDGDDHGSDACYAIAAGAGDSIIASGEVQRIAQGHDAWTRAYDAAGGILWSHELSTPSEGHDRGTGVVALPGGGALVAGTWYSGSNTQWNSFVLDVTSSGAAAWSELDEIVGDDRYAAIARDAGGRVFVAGTRPSGTGQAHAWLRALSADGLELWAVNRDAAGDAAGIAIAPGGDVVVAGTETNARTGADGWLAAYSPEGALRWSTSLASPGAGPDGLVAVAVSAGGSIAAVGSFGGAGTIRVYSAAGAPRWDVTDAAGPSWSGVAIDAAGDVVVTGSLGADLVVRKYTPAGALIWQRTIAGARGQAAAVDSHGTVLVCGAVNVAGGTTDALVVGFRQ